MFFRADLIFALSQSALKGLGITRNRDVGCCGCSAYRPSRTLPREERGRCAPISMTSRRGFWAEARPAERSNRVNRSPCATMAKPPIQSGRSAWRFPTQISAPRCSLTLPRPAGRRMKKPRQTRGLPRLQRRGWETMNPRIAFTNRSSKLLSDHDFRSVDRHSDSTQLAPAIKAGRYKTATSIIPGDRITFLDFLDAQFAFSIVHIFAFNK